MLAPSQRLKLTVSLLTAVAWGCASSGPASSALGRVPEPGSEVLHPAPPDTPRVQFLLAMSSEGDLQGRGGGGPAVVKPYGLDLNNGRLFVCDMYTAVRVVWRSSRSGCFGMTSALKKTQRQRHTRYKARWQRHPR